MQLTKTIMCLAVSGALCSSALASPWPTATPDYSTTETNKAVTISVLANDIGNELTLIAVNATSTRGGSAQLNADKQTVSYQPPTDYTGVDEFWYDFTDNEGRENAAKVSVYISDADPEAGEMPPEWPVAVKDVASVFNNNAIVIPVLDNDIGSGLTLSSVNDWSANGGRASINADNKTISYNKLGAVSSWPETDSLWYVFTDSWGRKNSAKVTIVLGTPETQGWPVALPDSANTTIDTSVKINALANDTGVALSLKSVNESSVKWGRIEIQDNQLFYTPYRGFTGVDEFWYVMENVYGETNSAKVVITVRPPDETRLTTVLNDTGATTCGDYAFGNSEVHNNDLDECSGTEADGDPIPAGQDATFGRDAFNNDDSDGHAGFSFTKLDAAGQPLSADATSWSCVKDNVTGLTWESKVAGAVASNLHSAKDRYTHYDSDFSSNGGVSSGTQQASSFPASCFGYTNGRPETYCNTEAFVQRVNNSALCGMTNWKLPTIPELQSIVDYDGRSPAIDTAYFPNTEYDVYSSASLSVRQTGFLKAVAFYDAHIQLYPQGSLSAVRLVSQAPSPVSVAE